MPSFPLTSFFAGTQLQARWLGDCFLFRSPAREDRAQDVREQHSPCSWDQNSATCPHTVPTFLFPCSAVALLSFSFRRQKHRYVHDKRVPKRACAVYKLISALVPMLSPTKLRQSSSRSPGTTIHCYSSVCGDGHVLRCPSFCLLMVTPSPCAPLQLGKEFYLTRTKQTTAFNH